MGIQEFMTESLSLNVSEHLFSDRSEQKQIQGHGAISREAIQKDRVSACTNLYSLGTWGMSGLIRVVATLEHLGNSLEAIVDRLRRERM